MSTALTGREEAWRFAPFKLFAPLLDRPAAVVEQIPLSTDAHREIAHSGGDATWRVEVSEHARAELTLTLDGDGEASVALDVHAGAGSSLRLSVIGRPSDSAVRRVCVTLNPGRDATIEMNSVTLNGRAFRQETTAFLAAPGGRVELRGLVFAADQDYLEQRLRVVHDAPHCTSNVVVKSAATDRSHIVWVGDIAITPAGVAADTYELNRNLVLSADARVDSVPNLELETGDVIGAGHASATGRFDDEQLFYLQSRGIPPEQARRMVVEGFFSELITAMSLGVLEEQVMSTIHERLEQR